MLRKLTVHICVEAQAADESPLAPLVAAALQEFIDSTTPHSKATGKFESKAGLDVTWATKNEYFDDKGNPLDPQTRKRPIAAAVNDAVSHSRTEPGQLGPVGAAEHIHVNTVLKGSA